MANVRNMHITSLTSWAWQKILVLVLFFLKFLLFSLKYKLDISDFQIYGYKMKIPSEHQWEHCRVHLKPDPISLLWVRAVERFQCLHGELTQGWFGRAGLADGWACLSFTQWVSWPLTEAISRSLFLIKMPSYTEGVLEKSCLSNKQWVNISSERAGYSPSLVLFLWVWRKGSV